MSLPATSEYSLGGKDVDLTNMIGVIKTPSGATEPCLLKKMSDGKLGIKLVSYLSLWYSTVQYMYTVSSEIGKMQKKFHHC